MIRETLQSVINEQSFYSPDNTDRMKRRGVLVRDQLPKQLRAAREAFVDALGVYQSEFDAGGRDGTGRKALIPWVRLFSKAKSPSPQSGWYVVFLFHPEGSGVSLCLSHGSTSFDGGSFRERDADEIARLMTWARRVLTSSLDAVPALQDGVRLGKAELAAAYEKTTVCSFFYENGKIPSDTQVLDHIKQLLAALRSIYHAQDDGREPGAMTPEVASALAASEALAAPLRTIVGGGQGRGLTAPQRKAVELHAMTKAKEWLTRNGFAYQDVSATNSYDFLATRHAESWVVEVKGTTGALSTILLTRNEVALHKARYPLNLLLVIYSIDLADNGYSTSGGTLVSFEPWVVEDSALTPISYEYQLPVKSN